MNTQQNTPLPIGPPTQQHGRHNRPQFDLDQLHDLISRGEHVPIWVTHNITHDLLHRYPHPMVVPHPGVTLQPPTPHPTPSGGHEPILPPSPTPHPSPSGGSEPIIPPDPPIPPTDPFQQSQPRAMIPPVQVPSLSGVKIPPRS